MAGKNEQLYEKLIETMMQQQALSEVLAYLLAEITKLSEDPPEALEDVISRMEGASFGAVERSDPSNATQQELNAVKDIYRQRLFDRARAHAQNINR